jgi:hypothetical protein
MTPQEWCRHVLNALVQRKLTTQQAGHVEVLLAYFIECDPTADELTALLARFVADPRPGIAAAAATLQGPWVRSRTVEETPTAPPLQEVLRTLGGLLDEAGAQAAYVAIGAEGVQLQQRQPSGSLAVCEMDSVTLWQQLAARTALRGQVPPLDPTDPQRFETRLRALGAQLDALSPQGYQLLVTRQTIAVAGSDGYDRIFSSEEIAAILTALVNHRQERDQPAA